MARLLLIIMLILLFAYFIVYRSEHRKRSHPGSLPEPDKNDWIETDPDKPIWEYEELEVEFDELEENDAQEEKP